LQQWKEKVQLDLWAAGIAWLVAAVATIVLALVAAFAGWDEFGMLVMFVLLAGVAMMVIADVLLVAALVRRRALRTEGRVAVAGVVTLALVGVASWLALMGRSATP